MKSAPLSGVPVSNRKVEPTFGVVNVSETYRVPPGEPFKSPIPKDMMKAMRGAGQKNLRNPPRKK